MIYKIIPPSPHLHSFVKDYTLLRFVFGKSEATPVKPFPANTQDCLVFYLKGRVSAYNYNTCTTKTFPNIAINGSQVSRFDFHLSPDFLLFSVNFQPGLLSKFLRSPHTEFVDERIDAEAILNPEIHEIYEQMANADTYESIVHIAEQYLWKRIQKVKANFQPIDCVPLFIAENPSFFCIKKLASDACLSISQFERRFIHQNGITPKFYARINRFYQAYQLKDKHPNLDWLSIAVLTGYCDYQHLVKDFKQFSGTTPNSLLLAQAHSPERILGIKIQSYETA